MLTFINILYQDYNSTSTYTLFTKLFFFNVNVDIEYGAKNDIKLNFILQISRVAQFC